MVVAFGEAVMLKGGLVLELRLERARTTKDVDLRLAGSSDDILERLQAAGALDLADFVSLSSPDDASRRRSTSGLETVGTERTQSRRREPCRSRSPLAQHGLPVCRV